MEGMRLKEQQERQEAVRLRQAAPHKYAMLDLYTTGDTFEIQEKLLKIQVE